MPTRGARVAWASGALVAASAVAGLVSPEARLALLVAATVVAGVPIARRALLGLRHRTVGIELLVTIAVVGALAIGEVWEAAAVTLLFAVGGALEAAVLDRTRRAVGALVDLTPREAVVLRDGAQVTTRPDDVAVGETVVLKPGARVPVDGTVLDGAVVVDESSVTGESVPVERVAGDPVVAGTVVAAGAAHVRAVGVGPDTLLARVIERVEEAQESRAPAQAVMERFARVYTPAVVLLAALVGVLGDVRAALTLLVIACPGALVISIPAALAAGIGAAARRGVLVKGGRHLEAAARVDVVALDKTGTLTTGRPALAEVLPTADLTADEVLLWAAAAETASEHPLATAVLRGARHLAVPARVDAAEPLPGLGVRATWRGRTVEVGSVRHLAGLPGADAAAPVAAEQAEAGRTPLVVALDGRVVGVLAVADTVRPGAADAVAALRRAGVRHVAMLTGDDPRVARAVAARVGIDDVRAGLLPEDKLDAVGALRARGRVVMVGDGVNDAPALAAADLGVAMGSGGTAVALETADVALMTDDLGRLVDLVTTARRTRRVLAQNLVVSLATVAALVLAALGGLSMGHGMLVHEASVLVVVANAVRLIPRRGAARPSTTPDTTAGTGARPSWQDAGTRR
jgi:Cd2+/Zn2+-exporting ATPase